MWIVTFRGRERNRKVKKKTKNTLHPPFFTENERKSAFADEKKRFSDMNLIYNFSV